MHEPKCSREGPACISYLASIPSTHAGREDPSTFRIHLYAAVEVPLFVLRHLVGYPRSQSASRGGLAANVQWGASNARLGCACTVRETYRQVQRPVASHW